LLTLVSLLSACGGGSAAERGDCVNILGGKLTPTRAVYAVNEMVRVEWHLFNCGSTDWAGYRVDRVGGTWGPESIVVDGWAPRTNGAIWFEAPAPPVPGDFRSVYELLSGEAVLGTIWVDLRVAPEARS
jgi:hypothetical protein